MTSSHGARLRPVGHGLAIALLVLGAVGCHDSGSPRTSTSRGPDSVAAFLQAFKPFREQGGIEADRSLILPADARAKCPVYPAKPRPALERKLGDALFQLSNIREEVALARPYLQFVARVRALHLAPPALRAVVRADVITAGQVRRFVGARLKLCDFFTKWRAHRWSRTYELRYLSAPFGRHRGMNRRRIDHAQRIAVAAVPGLRRLGASFQEATQISASASY